MTARGTPRAGGRDATFAGAAVPAPRYTARAERPRYGLVIGALTLSLAAATTAIAVWDKAATKETIYACPPECGRPPSALPVSAMPRFVAPGGEFTVGYPEHDYPDGEGHIYAVSTRADGVSAVNTSGDDGELQLFGEPAGGRDARRVVEDVIAAKFTGAGVAYEIPNAAVGYQPGYGVVINLQRPGSFTVSRAIVMAAVKNDLALVATAEGPFKRFTPDFGPGLPSAANVAVGMDLSKFADSFTWRGDPPR